MPCLFFTLFFIHIAPFADEILKRFIYNFAIVIIYNHD